MKENSDEDPLSAIDWVTDAMNGSNDGIGENLLSLINCGFFPMNRNDSGRRDASAMNGNARGLGSDRSAEFIGFRKRRRP
jgi:hypothetical protein